MNKLYLFVSGCILLAACQSNKPEAETTGIQYRGDTVTVAESAVVNSKIKLYTVATQAYSAEMNTTGVVRAMAGQLAEIAPPFDGRVTRSFVRLGQKVNAGTPVFELHSAEYFDAVKNYFQAAQTHKMQESNLRRQHDLVKNGVGAVRDLEEAETEAEIALREYENARATLQMLNIDPQEVTMSQAMRVVSPIAGEVVQTNMVIGQYVRSDAEPLAIVAELSKVWVVAQVKEKHIGLIRQDDQVEIRTDAHPEECLTGTISHISELLDEETRSVQVLIVCDNADRRLKPGMFANIHFIHTPKESIVIPSTALLQSEEESYVLVQTARGQYVKRPVEAETANPHEVLINKGLQPGDVLVIEGGIYLMAN